MKRTADGLKMIYEEKVNQQETDDNKEIKDLNCNTEEEIDQINEMITNLRDDIKSISRQAEREKEEAQQYRKEIGRAEQDKN